MFTQSNKMVLLK